MESKRIKICTNNTCAKHTTKCNISFILKKKKIENTTYIFWFNNEFYMGDKVDYYYFYFHVVCLKKNLLEAVLWSDTIFQLNIDEKSELKHYLDTVK